MGDWNSFSFLLSPNSTCFTPSSFLFSNPSPRSNHARNGAVTQFQCFLEIFRCRYRQFRRPVPSLWNTSSISSPVSRPAFYLSLLPSSPHIEFFPSTQPTNSPRPLAVGSNSHRHRLHHVEVCLLHRWAIILLDRTKQFIRLCHPPARATRAVGEPSCRPRRHPPLPCPRRRRRKLPKAHVAP